jgi:hypothetical protein
MPLTEKQRCNINESGRKYTEKEKELEEEVGALKAKKPRKRNCEELERACEETRTSLCHNEKHNPTTPTSGYNPATSTNSQVDVPLTSHQQSHLCFVRWRKKESIHNMKPAASSSTFATFYAVSSPPGRFNLGGPVPIRINRRSMRT